MKIFTINGPSLLSKYVGESEATIRKIFESAKNAEFGIVLFDQIDCLTQKRGESQSDKLVSQLLTCMDGVKDRGNVLVVATTNLLDKVDSALRRPGRFDREIMIKVPDISERHKLLETFFKNVSLDESVNL